MKELITKQPKRIFSMYSKMIERDIKKDFSDGINEDRLNNEDKIYYEIIQKGTYTACILTIDNEIVGLGMTKRDRNDKYNARVAADVSIHKALKDYLFGIEPEYLHIK